MTRLTLWALPLALLTAPLAAQAQEWRDDRAARRFERAPIEIFWEDGCRVEQRINRRGEIMQRRTCPDDSDAPRPIAVETQRAVREPVDERDDALAPAPPEAAPLLVDAAPAPLLAIARVAPVMRAPRQVTPARPVAHALSPVPVRKSASATVRPPVKPAAKPAPLPTPLARMPDKSDKTPLRPARAQPAAAAAPRRTAPVARLVKPVLALRVPARSAPLPVRKAVPTAGKKSGAQTAALALHRKAQAAPHSRAPLALALARTARPNKVAPVPVAVPVVTRARPYSAVARATSRRAAPAKADRPREAPPAERVAASPARVPTVAQAASDSSNQTAVRQTGSSASEWLVVLKPDQHDEPSPPNPVPASRKQDPMAQQAYDAYIAKKRRDPLSNL